MTSTQRLPRCANCSAVKSEAEKPMADYDRRDEDLGPIYCDYCRRYMDHIHPWYKCEGQGCECDCQEEPDRPKMSER